MEIISKKDPEDNFVSLKLLEDIYSKYFVKKNFATAYLKQNASNFDLSKINSVDELFGLTPTARHYWGFALSTILRGRESAKKIIPHLDDKINKKYLDVGCAYGGYLIAFWENGFDVTGIEINETLANLGKKNCSDYGINDAIITDDFLEQDITELGKFDVITCNDVIEHVHNTELTIEKLCSCLNKGGVLNFEIPNKNCISFIKEDGHFKLFGMNLLKREASLQYLANCKPQIYNNMKKNYPKHLPMGEFFDAGFYIDRLEKNGLSVKLDYKKHLIGGVDEFPKFLSQTVNAFNDFYFKKEQIDYFISEELIENFFDYIKNISRDYNQARYYGKSQDFLQKYMTTFWGITAKKIS